MSRHRAESRPSHGVRQALVCAVGALMLLAGVGLVLYPVVSSLRAQGAANAALDAWRSQAVVSDGAVAADPGDTYRPKEGDGTYEQLLAYNEEVRVGTGDAVNDPFAFGSDDLAALGLPNGIIGSVTIERLGETMPLYLGASLQNLSVGAGVVAGTSMPTGGADTMCVIAAHRAPYSGLNMFRDIETLEPGDTVVIETPWDTLTYQVERFDIIDPNDTAALAVEPGRDMVTLLTCHPYGYNYQRILVRCARVENPPSEAAVSSATLASTVAHVIWPGWSEGSPLLNLENVLRLAGLAIVLGLGIWIVAGTARRAGRRADERGGYRDDGAHPRSSGMHFR